MLTTNRLQTEISGLAILGAALALGLLCPTASAQVPAISPVTTINEAAAKPDIVLTPLRGNLTVVSGSGGNITVLTGTDGKFMVDGGISLSKDSIQAALAKISNAPLKYLVDTHYHWDHTDGNPWLHQAGATIIATPNTVKHLSMPTRVDDWKYTFKAMAPDGMPTVVISGPKTYNFDGESIELTPVVPAHTDSDLYVYFKKADVAVLGDLFWNGVYPFIDNEQGGGIDGMIKVDNQILAVITDKTIVVPGHGPVGNRKDLVAFRDMLVGIRNNVGSLKKQGKSLADVVASKPTAAFDATYGKFVIGPDFFTKIVYDGIK
jgi:glyoxylase-like metal-dependent hydrolase (beta-lactamase superfamily II)